MNSPENAIPAFGASAGAAWFSHCSDGADDGWSGPHKHMEDAIAAIAETPEWEYGIPIYVRRGRKLTKAERDEWGVEYSYQCDPPSIEVTLPERQGSPMSATTKPSKSSDAAGISFGASAGADSFTIRLYRSGDVWHAMATDDETGEHAGGMGLRGDNADSIADALECVARCINSYRAVRMPNAEARDRP